MHQHQYPCNLCLDAIKQAGIQSVINENWMILRDAVNSMPKETKDKPSAHDDVNAPKHYRAGDVYETIRVIEAWGLDKDFYLANAIKYISRFNEKEGVKSLEKAVWYMQRKIEKMKNDSK